MLPTVVEDTESQKDECARRRYDEILVRNILQCYRLSRGITSMSYAVVLLYTLQTTIAKKWATKYFHQTELYT